MKLKKAVSEYQNITGKECYLFECPGCGHAHMFITKAPQEPVWGFNGNLEKPTFTPSLLNRHSGGEKDYVCHLFVTDGKIQFLGDCTHPLKGQTVDMLEIE